MFVCFLLDGMIGVTVRGANASRKELPDRVWPNYHITHWSLDPFAEGVTLIWVRHTNKKRKNTNINA